MAEMGGGEGLPLAATSYQEMAEMGGGKRLPGDCESCQRMAEIEGEMRLPLVDREWQKWGVEGAAVSCRELPGNCSLEI